MGKSRHLSGPVNPGAQVYLLLGPGLVHPGKPGQVDCRQEVLAHAQRVIFCWGLARRFVASLGKWTATGNPGAQEYLLLGLCWASLGKSRQVGGERESWSTGLSAGAWLGNYRQV